MGGELVLDSSAADLDLEPEQVADSAEPAHPAGFALLVLVTAVIFLRPSELVPALRDLPIYEPLIVGCLLFSLPAVFSQLRWESLVAQPATLCVVALLPAVFLSNLTNGDVWRARTGALEFVKVLLYYLLLTGLVTTPQRFRRFLLVIAVFILGIASLSLLHFHDVIYVKALDPMEQQEAMEDDWGDRVLTIRLQASGIFNDPNDFALILVVGALICLHLTFDTERWAARLCYLAPIPMYLYGVALTRSRGGFLSLLAGLSVFAVCRFGRRRALRLGAVFLPLMLLAFGGRQTNITLTDEEDTGHARVEIWSEALQLMKQAPVFGGGYGVLRREIGIVAHNSFVHSYAELGFFGGTLFLGAFYLPLSSLRNQRNMPGLRVAAERESENGIQDEDENEHEDGEGNRAVGEEAAASADDEQPGQKPAASGLLRWRPCMLAVLSSYAVGLCALSRGYTVSTYLILGIATAFCGLTVVPPRASDEPVPISQVFRHLVRLSCCALVALYLFVKVMV